MQSDASSPLLRRGSRWRHSALHLSLKRDWKPRTLSESWSSVCLCLCVCVSSASVELDSAGNTLQLSSLSNESLGWVFPSSSSNSSPESRIMSELRLRRMQPSIPPHMMSLVSGMMSLAANQTRAGIVRANQTPGGPAHRTFCPRWRSQLWNEVMQRKADKSSLRGESSQLLRGWDEVQRIRFYG